MSKLSKKFLINLKFHNLPAYRIAQMADLDPALLSKLINGIDPIRPNDERILRVAEVLGMSRDEVFEEQEG